MRTQKNPFCRVEGSGRRGPPRPGAGRHGRSWRGRHSRPMVSSLDRVALEMTSTLELSAVLASITGGLVEDFGVALARVWLVEPGDSTLHLRASSGLSTRLDGTYAQVLIGAHKIGQIAQSRQALWTNDLLHDERVADPEWAQANRLVAFAGWPLTFRDTLQGVLATFSRAPMTEEERPRMALFAHQAAIAIQNARLFAAVTQLEERLRAENAYLRREAQGGDGEALAMLSRCAGLEAVLALVGKVAPTSTSVLVQGETGTGKELIARALHELSPRRSGPLVKVNCAALSPTLVESELFGHEKGAFTGAQKRRVGRFELADGGTLLLDEVGELPLELQPKLLRVLQEQELERVGGTRPVPIDVRIVAATNRNLSKAVEAGRFRADLFYRLAVFPIEVPPLRDRMSDCVVLADAFLRSQAHRLGKTITGLTPRALDALLAHDWPGNVRELANVIERAAIVATGSLATEADLPPLAHLAPREGDGAARLIAPARDTPLETVERWHIVRVLERAGWVVEGKDGAAAILGLAPSTLRSRMAHLGVRRSGT